MACQKCSPYARNTESRYKWQWYSLEDFNGPVMLWMIVLVIGSKKIVTVVVIKVMGNSKVTDSLG